MINAKQATEQAQSNKISLIKENVEKSIKGAIKKGRNEVFIMSTLPEEIIQELASLDYLVEKQKTGMRISW